MIILVKFLLRRIRDTQKRLIINKGKSTWIAVNTSKLAVRMLFPPPIPNFYKAMSCGFLFVDFMDYDRHSFENNRIFSTLYQNYIKNIDRELKIM